jgi:HEPN domain-containing protein
MGKYSMPLSDGDPKYWFELASRDEESAEILRRELGPREIAAYHYHQAAEKLLKGAILSNKTKFPFIHDLQRLYGILRKVAPELLELSDAIIELQSMYTDFRYPHGDLVDAIRLEKAHAAYELIKSAILT